MTCRTQPTAAAMRVAKNLCGQGAPDLALIRSAEFIDAELRPLLEACEAGLRWANEVAMQDSGDDERHPMCLAAEVSARTIEAAVAKAKGGAA